MSFSWGYTISLAHNRPKFSDKGTFNFSRWAKAKGQRNNLLHTSMKLLLTCSLRFSRRAKTKRKTSDASRWRDFQPNCFGFSRWAMVSGTAFNTIERRWHATRCSFHGLVFFYHFSRRAKTKGKTPDNILERQLLLIVCFNFFALSDGPRKNIQRKWKKAACPTDCGFYLQMFCTHKQATRSFLFSR